MKKLLLVFAAIMISSFAITTASAQAGDAAKPKTEEPKKADDKKAESPVVGVKWDVVISAPGQDYAGVLKIDKDGAGFKGSVTTELGEAPLGGIKVDGASFTSTIAVNAQGQIIEGTMSGKVKDGKIAGDLNLSGLGSIPYTGKKP
ncbi:MAG: hypothetical protein ABL999_18470 [Pyrinomonadaceae bacterium]